MTFADLPAVNAAFNGLAACFLLAGYVFIRRQNRTAHRDCMIAALASSALFLAGYLTYHTYVAYVLHKGPTVFKIVPAANNLENLGLTLRFRK